ncbi:class F sortase [Streptomyces maoxianensis]|uniref:Class F sortase n=1 Tax=Streptomyces maoxianensis TaxID=1459942 RepID=A0ABV9GEN0_9ACTN|nr:class F sortase [Streptomyces sp. ISL-1]MBT2388479.1 class F sortase [Streptomyces sp. ISL-1]
MRLHYGDSEKKRRSPWGVLALALLSGIAMIRNGADVSLGPPQPAAAASIAGRGQGETFLPFNLEPLAYAPAERVRIPAIGVDAPVMNVGLDKDGWIAPPPAHESNMAGWYQNGIAPGQRGTAVVVGHVDNLSGPAVFYGLGSIQKGQHVEVSRFDGKTVVFEVYGVEVFSKQDFPGSQVYGDTGQAELRVITCGGGYTKANGYSGNVVVFGRMVRIR